MSKNFDHLIVAAIQMTSTTVLKKNLESASCLIAEASSQGAKLIVLPEYFTVMGKDEKAKLQLTESHGHGQVQDFLSRHAKEYQVWLVGGTHSIESNDLTKPFSRCYVYAPSGDCVCWYDKIHLFDVLVADSTRHYAESAFCSAGERVISFDTPWGKAGLAVCYDLRFPELFRQLAKQQVKFLLIPAAFTAHTGEAHWEVLLKARAIENQAFVIAAAQSGLHENGRETWGHSCIISPWGDRLAIRQQTKPGVVLTHLNLSQLEKLRNEFPVLSHTRL